MPIRRLLAATAVLLAVSSCGDDDAVASGQTGAEVATADEQVTVTLRFTQEVSEEDRQTTARVLDARLDGAGLTGATVLRSGALPVGLVDEEGGA